MTNVQKMTHKELIKKIIDNRVTLRITKNADMKRRLIAENHEMMTELDRRYAAN